MGDISHGEEGGIFKALKTHSNLLAARWRGVFYAALFVRHLADDILRDLRVADARDGLVEVLRTLEQSHPKHSENVCPSRNF